jgi:hypothetical protein
MASRDDVCEEKRAVLKVPWLEGLWWDGPLKSSLARHPCLPRLLATFDADPKLLAVIPAVEGVKVRVEEPLFGLAVSLRRIEHIMAPPATPLGNMTCQPGFDRRGISSRFQRQRIA